MKAFFRFIAGTTGRVIRIVAGLALIAIGILWVGGTGGWILRENNEPGEACHE